MVAEVKTPPGKQRETLPPTRRRAPERRIAIWGPLLVVLALALMLIAGIWRHISQESAQKQFSQQMSKTSVDVVSVKADSKPHKLWLPGNIVANLETTIFARANGYVAKWLVDIGDRVKTGQVLAELETPELDQELQSARGNLQQSQANYDLAKVTAERWQQLAQKLVVSKEDNDTRQSNFHAAEATLSANKATVGQFEALQAFKHVTAPFDGIITSRKIDVGSLVSQGSGTAGTALFSLAQTDPVRIFVDVPQSDAPLVTVGMEAKLFVRERPNRNFTGKVFRTAGAIDPTSRTMLTEVDVPNHDGALFTGMYAQVKFTLTNPNGPITIPANAFVFRAEGPLVAVVTNENKIHWQPIKVGRDFGTYMEVLRGLDENARVVVNPTDDLTEGLKVEPKEAPPAQQDPAKPGSSQKGQSQQDQGQQGKTQPAQPAQGQSQPQGGK
ncbi:MAG TPA: efflux RND transporter periplasmic adaptor subunit [Chthoniobacter sp.]|jgi:RND family efflux transporter MFP subunit